MKKQFNEAVKNLTAKVKSTNVTLNEKVTEKAIAKATKAEAKADKKKQALYLAQSKAEAKAEVKAIFTSVQSVHNSFFNMIKTALKVANYGVNTFDDIDVQYQKRLAYYLRDITGTKNTEGLNILPSVDEVAKAINKYSAYLYKEEKAVYMLKKVTKVKEAVFCFEKAEYTFSLIIKAFQNKQTGKKAVYIEDIKAFYNKKNEVITNEEAKKAIKEAEAKAKAEADKKEAEAKKQQAEDAETKKLANLYKQLQAEADKKEAEAKKEKRQTMKQRKNNK